MVIRGETETSTFWLLDENNFTKTINYKLKHLQNKHIDASLGPITMCAFISV